uniref:Fanconi anemia core complex-associated protein 24 n=1 Tax=Tursiops truncatus TaxID=9739 RepID=A0A2U4BTJ5_TURTR|nr:Fanconi anemia core complex-associated protein 24 isoform X1 [Tursiops truncatus]XP_019796550.1 Fanconi anemia core complex-associated protein 24 isoform X1 [Tursiops truncatus]XP_059855992.1 Fanconi anemia core complex-associated protein 24 isoform X1 [Delphinus delphis]
MEGNTLDGTGPMHVPFGHIVANEKWRGSQLAQGMQGKIKLVFEDGLTPVDFYLSSRSCILYITEADLVAGNGYRKRLVRVRNSSKLQGIVVVEKTHMSEQYFPAVQKFTVLDLGMVLLPVASQTEASCLIIQLVEEQTKEPSKNPLLRKKRALISEPALLRTVQQIPGVGKVKAPLLLQRFPSIQQLSNASIQELEPVVGQSVAQHIYAFFTQSRNTPHTLVRTLLSSLHVSWISAHTNRYRSTSFPLKTVQGPVMRILNFSNFLNVK